MLEKIKSFAIEHNMFPETGTVLVCVSGGADSMCLLEALSEILCGNGLNISVAHYNHRLRGEESDRDEMFVREYCLSRGFECFAGAGDVGAFAALHGLSIEEAAREARYEFFLSTAQTIGAVRIATAHTADDNAETMIINLARGAGAAGLSGIPPVRQAKPETRDVGDYNGKRTPVTSGEIDNIPLIIRPMLRVSRDEVKRYIEEHHIPYVEDSTNGLDIYTRNKVRHIIMPVLREINLKYHEAAATAAALLRGDEEYLSSLADGFIADHSSGSSLDVKALAKLPFAVSGRVLRKLCGGYLSYNHVKAVLELCNTDDPSAGISLPGKTVYREYDRLIFENAKEREPESFAAVYPEIGTSMIIPELELKLSCKEVVYDDILRSDVNKSFTSFLFKSSEIRGRMTVRPRFGGDSVRLKNRDGTKTLKKLFIEQRLPARKRPLIPVIADDKGVLAVYGMGIGDRAVPEPGDRAIQIIFEVHTNEK